MFVGRSVSPLRALAATAALLCCAPGTARAQDAPAPVESIDLYGTDAISPDAFRAEFGAELERFVGMLEAARTRPNPDVAAIERQGNVLEARIRSRLGSLVPIADIQFGATTDFGPPPRIHVMIDVVEEADKARRMPFYAPPAGRFDDPGDVLALWDEFQEKVVFLAYGGTSLQISACPVLHCIAPFELPQLMPYLERINAGAREHQEELYKIAAESGDASQRATALFVLAHTNDAERLLPVLGRAIYDPSGGVRNNAMRVLMFMAQKRPELDFPIDDLITALDFPSNSDRNKAGYTLAALAAQPKYRDTIRAKAVPTLLRMLRLAQPNNHDPAYQTLKIVSGEAFGDRDYAAWERWAASRN